MATRPLSELIEEVRFNTNNTDLTDPRFTDARLLKFFNSAQRQLQKVIFRSNPINNPFSKEYDIPIKPNVGVYDLPEDIFALSSITNIAPVFAGGSLAKPLRKTTIKERNNDYGYYIANNMLYLTPKNLVNTYACLRMNYVFTLPDAESVLDEFEFLPRAVEDFLMAFVERKMNYVDSSGDTTISNSFTEEERQEIIELFKDNSTDIKYPVMSDETYFNY